MVINKVIARLDYELDLDAVADCTSESEILEIIKSAPIKDYKINISSSSDE